jgi:hypothetical protein
LSKANSPQPPKNVRNDELTSLELLTIKNPTIEEYRTPIKISEKKMIGPASEPILASKEKEESPLQPE